MADIFYDIETKELIDTAAPDQDAAIRALTMSVGVTFCDCHDTQTFHTTAPLAKHLLAHDRIIGFNIIHFDNAVLAWSPERSIRDPLDPSTLRIPDAPPELKKLLDQKSFDLLADLETRLGHRVGLAALAEGSLGKQKLASGPQAVVWNRLAATLRDKWADALTNVGDPEGAERVNELGEWFQERLEKYCLQDVLLVKKILEYGIANKRVAYVDFEGARRVVKVQWR
jgi:DEAD/DEAH box helicase domain-containing protein